MLHDGHPAELPQVAEPAHPAEVMVVGFNAAQLLALHHIEQDEDDILPSFMYTEDGVYEVPNAYIARDFDEPVYMTAREWRLLLPKHRALNTATILERSVPGQEMYGCNVVCLIDTAHRPPNTPVKVLWMVRVAVNGGSHLFDNRFGGGFLWQLSSETVEVITRNIKKREFDEAIPPEHGSQLLRSLACTHQTFAIKDWPLMKKAEYVDNYYDAVFAMACKPSTALTEPPEKGTGWPLTSLARPDSMQPAGKKMYFDSATAIDDAMHCVMEAAVWQLVKTPLQEDLAELLKLRLVSKQWKQVVEQTCVAHYNDALDCVKEGVATGSTRDIIIARDKVLDSGLATLSMIQDSGTPTDFGKYLRVRCGKKASDRPAAPAEETACVPTAVSRDARR